MWLLLLTLSAHDGKYVPSLPIAGLILHCFAPSVLTHTSEKSFLSSYLKIKRYPYSVSSSKTSIGHALPAAQREGLVFVTAKKSDTHHPK